MEERISLGERIHEFVARNILIIGLIAIGVVLCAVGLTQYFASKSDNGGVEIIAGSNSNQKSEVNGSADIIKKIAIDVAGQVQKPGVYQLDDGARLQDALSAAGGLTETADREYMAKRLNLAQKVVDGGKVYIPSIGEVQIANTSNLGSNSSTDTTTMAIDTASSLIDINSAEEKTLDTLPQVGPVTAKKIINNRPYGVVEELVSKKVMSQKTFDGLKDRITVQ